MRSSWLSIALGCEQSQSPMPLLGMSAQKDLLLSPSLPRTTVFSLQLILSYKLVQVFISLIMNF